MAYAGPHAGWARSGRQHSGSGSNWAIYSRLGQDPVRKHVVSGHLAPRHQLISHRWSNARTYVNITQWRFRSVVRICNLWEITLETFSGSVYDPGGWIIHLHCRWVNSLCPRCFKVNANTLPINRELSWCQFCHWQHYILSVWQPVVSVGTTKLILRQLSFSACIPRVFNKFIITLRRRLDVTTFDNITSCVRWVCVFMPFFDT